MEAGVVVARNRADAAEVGAHLRACDASFVPPLSERVELGAYAAKIVSRAERFEAWSGDRLAALVAAYCNEPERRTAFITSVSVLPSFQVCGLASRLLQASVAHVRLAGFERIELEMDARNSAALALYRRHGFAVASTREHTLILQLTV
ncbi:MAG: GNAT family N-acetyltransferase [Burkholderiales bacterium]|nr:GNAT family N-acetyltransferase [Burkholderiales bacterium]